MRRYGVWLGAATLSLLGTQVMAFAMAWVAAGRGGAFAGLVLTAINLPRLLLLLLGGAVADRVGAHRVMIVADVAMTALTLGLAGAVWRWGDRPVLLLGAALAIGIVDAFYLPSSGSMPRLLVPGADLARAMSARQMAGQLVAFAGPALGGLVVAATGLAAVGLAAAAAANAATFALMAAVLIAIRPQRVEAEPGGREALWRQAVDGLRTAAADRVLRPALLTTAAAAAFLLPVSGLLVPLLARQRHWPATSGGAVAGAIALGMATVAGAVLLRGAHRRPSAAANAGLLVASVGIAALAVAPGRPAAVGAGALVGLGSGLFSAHIGPLILGATPGTHLARIQAVLVLVQGLPLLVTNNALGALADAGSVNTVLLFCAAALAAVTTGAHVSSSARSRMASAVVPPGGGEEPGEILQIGRARRR